MAVLLYVFGLVFVLMNVAAGYEGGDLLTEHYRGVLQAILN